MSATDGIFPGVPTNIPVPFKNITVMWSHRYDELNEIWKTKEVRYDENTTEVLVIEHQHGREPY